MASLKVPHPVPSPAEDAESLRKAFEGFDLPLLIMLFDLILLVFLGFIDHVV